MVIIKFVKSFRLRWKYDQIVLIEIIDTFISFLQWIERKV